MHCEYNFNLDFLVGKTFEEVKKFLEKSKQHYIKSYDDSDSEDDLNQGYVELVLENKIVVKASCQCALILWE